MRDLARLRAFFDNREREPSCDRRGWVRDFQYDVLIRNTAEIWYNNETDVDADQNRQNTLAFTYDLAGQMLTAGDAAADYTYAYLCTCQLARADFFVGRGRRRAVWGGGAGCLRFALSL